MVVIINHNQAEVDEIPKNASARRWRIGAFGVLALFASIAGATLISGFEAHVINVTAKIEQNLCEAKDYGYWATHEGCFKGNGSSDWAEEVQELSSHYSGVFATATGGDMCAAIWVPNCPSGNTVAARRCRAKVQALALELNIVSHRLHPDAFLAGADDGDDAFSHLALSENSTIHQALIAIEAAIANPGSSKGKLKDAGYVAERIIEFYEEENPFAPQCIFDPGDIPECRNDFKNGSIKIINDNESTVTNNVNVSSNTGNNSGGTVITGDASSSATIINIVNTNDTTIGCCEADSSSQGAAAVRESVTAPVAPEIEERTEAWHEARGSEETAAPPPSTESSPEPVVVEPAPVAEPSTESTPTETASPTTDPT